MLSHSTKEVNMETEMPHRFSEIAKILLEDYEKASLFRMLFLSQTAILHYFKDTSDRATEVIKTQDFLDDLGEALIREVFEKENEIT